MKEGGAEIAHEQNLTFGVAGAGGDDEEPDFFGAVVDDQGSGEEAVGHHVLEDIVGGGADHHKATGDEVGRLVDIPLRKEDGLGFAGGAARGVETTEAVGGHGDEAGGILVAEISIGGERQATDVVESSNLVAVYPGFGELALVERHVAPDSGHGVLEAFQLE